MPKRNRHREFARAYPAGASAAQGTTTASAPVHVQPPSSVQRVRTPAEAEQLASRLLNGAPWPIAVVSIPSGAQEPFIDADELKHEVGDLGEVVLMPTDETSRAFSRAMPDMTQVYGGAGRVYRVDRTWMSDPYRSPLRFAYSRGDSTRVVDALARDLAAFALEAGLTNASSPVASQAHAAGTVKATVAGSRAMLVLDDDSYATIWAELTVPDVPIDHVVTPGQRVHGVLDVATRRLDVRDSLRPAAQALAEYAPGMTVVARVEAVASDTATLAVYPGVTTALEHGRITDNPLDDIRDLLSPGEVVIARLESLDLSRAPSCELRLDTVDDDDEPVAAPALLAGGPPWLVLTLPKTDPEPAPPPVVPAVLEPVAAFAPATTTPVARATPLDAGRRTPAVANPAHLDEIRELRRTHQWLESENARLRRDRDNLRTRLRTSGSQRRKAERAARGPGDDLDLADLFSDPVEQFRFEVHLEWARRIPAGQKAELPLRDYDIGSSFLPSLEQLQGVERAKVVSVVVEVVTGLAAGLDSRELHPLRTDRSGGSPTVRRPGGATCMRVALQRNSPAARRMHFWQLGDHVELSRVTQHDDMTP
ncbi:hypothetical protein ACT17Q_15675 [Cellulomonas sp. CW35]|uniref:hypothetical protein n=1 Tax=Cellulomonas sp. CW35 TaxID=3458249 RepID=UPI0040340078